MVHRDIELCPADRRPHPPAAPVDGAAASSSCGRPRPTACPSRPRPRPHHLALTDEALRGYDPVFKVNPPLRTAADIAALKAGLADGTIDAIATDHAPHPVEDKERPIDDAPPGMLGLETALGVALAVLDLPLADVVAALSWKPAAIAGVGDRHGVPDRGRQRRQPGRLRPRRALAGRARPRWPAAAATRRTSGATCSGKVRHTVFRGTPVVIDGAPQR